MKRRINIRGRSGRLTESEVASVFYRVLGGSSQLEQRVKLLLKQDTTSDIDWVLSLYLSDCLRSFHMLVENIKARNNTSEKY